jgi:glycerophosphoryl diester phosphodiesterase
MALARPTLYQRRPVLAVVVWSVVLPISLSSLPAVIGHRCARAVAPENTLAGLDRAVALGVRWVEVDVRLSADGVPVVIHDPTLERTTSGQGAVAATPLAALSRLDAGAWFDPAFAGEPVPTLEAFLGAALARGIGVNLELKGDAGDPVALAETALTLARRWWGAGADRPLPLISSFDQRCLVAAARVAPDWPRGVLLETLTADALARADSIGAAVMIIDHETLTGAADVAALAVGGRPVLTYTVNEPARVRELRRWGVSAVITDRPDAAMVEAGRENSTI